MRGLIFLLIICSTVKIYKSGINSTTTTSVLLWKVFINSTSLCIINLTQSLFHRAFRAETNLCMYTYRKAHTPWSEGFLQTLAFHTAMRQCICLSSPSSCRFCKRVNTACQPHKASVDNLLSFGVTLLCGLSYGLSTLFPSPLFIT